MYLQPYNNWELGVVGHLASWRQLYSVETGNDVDKLCCFSGKCQWRRWMSTTEGPELQSS